MFSRSHDANSTPFRAACWAALAASGFSLAACGPGRNALPPEIEVDAILASQSVSGLREGCEAAIYRLSDETARHLLKGGLKAIQATTSPRRENPRNGYGAWVATPVPPWFGTRDQNHEPVYAYQAMGGCSSKGDWHSAEIGQALSTPGSYYAVTSNGEGMIVIAPQLKLAGYFYAG